jgi:hypothetical protein
MTAKEILDDSVRRYAAKEKFRRNKCEKKCRYASIETAAFAIAGLRKAGDRRALNVYRCEFCDGFHVGHPKTIKKSRWWGSRQK